MQSLSRLIFAFFLSIVFLFNTAVAYAIPQNIDSSFYDTSDGAAGIAIVEHKRFADGSITNIIINPSTSGAAAGAAAGAAVGTVVCTTSAILAPSAPICAGVGALIGGVTGLVFGSSG